MANAWGDGKMGISLRLLRLRLSLPRQVYRGRGCFAIRWGLYSQSGPSRSAAYQVPVVCMQIS